MKKQLTILTVMFLILSILLMNIPWNVNANNGIQNNNIISSENNLSSRSPGTITANGYFRYLDQNTGTYKPIRDAWVELCDKGAVEGSLDSWYINWSIESSVGDNYTDPNGYFSITAYNEELEGFGPSPDYEPFYGPLDIFVRVVSVGNLGIVGRLDPVNGSVFDYNDATGQANDTNFLLYEYIDKGDSPVINDVPDGTYNFQNVNVTNPAFNVYDQILNGYQYIDNLPNTDPPPKIVVRWETGQTHGTHYHNITDAYPVSDAPDRGFIHLLSDTGSDTDEWDNGVILHEYGHNIACVRWRPTKQYHFDNSPGGDHSWANSYTPELAWSEGWAHYFACVVRNNQTYRDTFAPGVWQDVNLETGVLTTSTGGTFDGNSNGADCEAAVSGILWDIYDSANDDQNADSIGDYLSAGDNAIWDVVQNYATGGHGVYTIHEFWDGWFVRGHGNATAESPRKIWAVYYEHGENKDATPPQNPTYFHYAEPESGWYSNNTINVFTLGGSDPDTITGVAVNTLSGVYGYSYEWTNATDTIPDNTVDVLVDYMNPSYTFISPPLTDDSWYLHIRTCDWAGNWNPSAAHVGPFNIDTTSAFNPISYTSSHNIGIWSNINTVIINWSGAFDNTSGIAGYSWLWNNYTDTIPDNVTDGNFTITSNTTLLSDGEWYFHIRAVDNASNWATNAYHIGPFKIDTTNTTNNPTNYTSTQMVNVWSNNNTIEIGWSGAYDNMSGIKGYSWIWDTNESTIPDTIVDGNYTITSNSSIPLTDGTWYFHIRAVDNASNWAIDVYHIGPFYVDTTPPTNVTTSPVNNSVNISVSATITIIFDENMNGTSVNESNVNITPTVGYTITWLNDTTLQIRFTTNLNYNTTYTIRIDNAKDRAGNTISKVFSFTTKSKGEVEGDGVAPELPWLWMIIGIIVAIVIIILALILVRRKPSEPTGKPSPPPPKQK